MLCLFFWLCGFWIWTDPEHRESKETTLSTGVEISGLEGHWGGGELQCRDLQLLCEGLLGGSSVEEGVGQPARVP